MTYSGTQPGAGSGTGPIFVTGAGGFLGRALLPRLAATGRPLKLLLRRPVEDLPEGAEVITGDLCAPETYRAALDGVDTVIHMAALTGKAAPREYTRINTEATGALVEAARAAGVDRFLFVSSIAAGYPDQRYYPYAQSKRAAEALVQASGLQSTILRPTLVLGEGSPIWDTLSKIAGAPVIPLPQRGGAVQVQPVHVDDVARGIVTVLEDGRFQGEIFDVGGRDAVPFATFLSLMQEEAKGRSPRVIPVPLRPIQMALALIEPVARGIMPATAGQLSVFGNASAAEQNWLMDRLMADMPSTADLVRQLSAQDRDGSGGPKTGIASGTAPEDLAVVEALPGEAVRFSRYLSGLEPSDDVVRHFVAAARQHGLAGPATRFDRATLALARTGSPGLKVADAFCGLFHRSGSLRRRLVLMLAILEHSAATAPVYDLAPDHGPARAFLGLAGTGLGFGLALLAGVLVFLPLKVVLRGA